MGSIQEEIIIGMKKKITDDEIKQRLMGSISKETIIGKKKRKKKKGKKESKPLVQNKTDIVEQEPSVEEQLI